MSGSKRRRALHYLKAQLGLLSPAAGRFETLPVELVEEVATNMDRLTLSTFRTTCSYVARCTDYHFKREYHSTFRTDFSTGSMRRLQKRIQDPEYAKGIKTLAVGVTPVAVEEYQKDSTYPLLGGYFKFHRDADGELPVNVPWPAGPLTPTDCSQIILHLIKDLQIPVVSFDIGLRWCADGRRGGPRLNMREFLDDPIFQTAWSKLQSFRVTGYYPEDGSWPAARLILAAKNLKTLTLATNNIEDHLMESLALGSSSLSLEEICFRNTTIWNILDQKSDKTLALLLSQRNSLKRLVFSDTLCFRGVLHTILRELKKAGGFRALEQLVFEQCQCKDGQKVMISGQAYKIKPGKSTVTNLLWAERPENNETLQWSTHGPNAPKSVIELQALVDLARW
ncbi:hypothetical protein BJX66DRAFT_338972 [Aspergillus keveii]|uniref:F-box domain-containing protein n=1 Tax=Aspergillus keveii TaxID=714993 RepID=A0ABR4G2W9_9EURO